MKRRAFLSSISVLSVCPNLAISQDERVGGLRIVENQDVQIATQAFGSPEDPALVLIMGATASMLGWPDEFCTALADHGYYVIRFDHRDTGQSTTFPLGQANYTVEDLTDDVVSVLGAYQLDQAHVLGMSLGGYVAQMLAC